MHIQMDMSNLVPRKDIHKKRQVYISSKRDFEGIYYA
jgi:hypothetical protein